MHGSLLFVLISLAAVLTGCRNSGHGRLTVITFNIRYDNPRDSLNAWPNRKTIVCEFLKSEDPDLFGLQEALWHQYEAVDSALDGYGSVSAGRDDGRRKGETNPVFFRKSRFELLGDSTFWLSLTPGVPGSKGWGASLPRIVTWVKLKDKITGKVLFYFNTHFAHDSDSARIMSAGILLSQVRRIAGESSFVITGDFNMPPGSRAYSILTEQDSSEPLMKDSYIVSETTPAGPVPTFNGWNDAVRGSRIDYVFVRSGTRIESVSTLTIKRGPVFISDHWPVRAVISMPSSGNASPQKR